MKSRLSLVMVFLFSVNTMAFSADNPFKTSNALDAKIREGLAHLYNLDFDKGDKVFEQIYSEAPEHPMVAFGKASVQWWRLSVYVLETDSEESEKFITEVNNCIRFSKEKIERGDPTGEGYLTLGGAYGLLGRWQATNQEWMSAYFTGKKAIKYLRKALKVNPEMKDANMGLGIFDYYVATLPAVVRVLAFLGSGGKPQVGIDELTVAAYEGTYAQTPSRLFLAEIYSNPENKPEKALEILTELKKEYPKSPFIHMMNVIAYYNHQRIDELTAESKSFQERVENGTYRKEFEVQSRFALGITEFKQRRWQEAIDQFDKGIKAGTEKDSFYSWSYLYKASALDVLGRREEAIAVYKDVLKQLRRWGSWDAAKKGLKTPYKGTDEDLKKLKL